MQVVSTQVDKPNTNGSQKHGANQYLNFSTQNLNRDSRDTESTSRLEPTVSLQIPQARDPSTAVAMKGLLALEELSQYSQQLEER